MADVLIGQRDQRRNSARLCGSIVGMSANKKLAI